MDFKVKIKCFKCLCSFEIRSHKIDVKHICCPNCGSAVDDTTAEHLCNGLSELAQVKNYDDSLLSLEESEGFSFEIVAPDPSFGTFI